MSDTANIVGKVTADTTQAVRSVDTLKRSVDTAGGAFGGFANKASSAIGSAADALGKFNLALGGIQKAIDLGGSVISMAKFSAEAKFAEQRVRELGSSAYELGNAVGGTVDDVTLLKFGLKQLQGESALTKDQLLLVLKAADSLGDQGFGDTMKIAEDLARALKGGPTKALRDYNIDINDLKGSLDQANELMGKMRDIAAQTVQNDDIERIERLQTAWQNLINTLKSGAGYLVDAASWVGAQYGDHSALMRAGGNLDDEGFMHFQMQKFSRLRNQTMTNYNNNQLAWELYRGGYFDQAASALDAWSNLSFSGAPGASWFTPSAKKKGGRGGARDIWSTDQGNGSLNPSAVYGGLAAEYQRQFAAQQQRESDFQIGATNRELSNTWGDSMSESIAQINQSADELREKGLADLFEQLNQVMIVGTPAVVAFADALMSGGNAFSALAKGLQQGLRALAIDSAVKALYALGEGLLFNNPKQLAASAKYSAAAVAAGIGSAAIGAMVGGGGGGASAGASGGAGASPASIGGGSGGGYSIVVNVQGVVGEPAEVGRVINNAIDTARRTGRSRDRGISWT